jgi:ParB family transcriptional regulator, chromosome partitioning protein
VNKDGSGKTQKLGRGLSALLGKTAEKSNQKEIADISVTAIDANVAQPRRKFREDVLADMAESIKAHGLLQPISVRKKADGRYELIAGEQRLRATKLAGLATISAVVLDVTAEESAELALIENLQRSDLNVMEEARAYASLMKSRDCTQEELAKALGKSRSYIANIVRLVTFSPNIQQLLIDGKATIGQLRPLLALQKSDDQEEIAKLIVKENLSARDAEALVKQKKSEKGRAGKKKQPVSPYLVSLEKELRLSLGTQVRIQSGVGKKAAQGKISISFKNEEEFERIVSFLKQNQ